MKERQLHDAIFRKEWGDLFAVWNYCETSSKSDFDSFDLVRQCEDWRSRSYRRLLGRKNERLRNGRLWREAVIGEVLCDSQEVASRHNECYNTVINDAGLDAFASHPLNHEPFLPKESLRLVHV